MSVLVLRAGKCKWSKCFFCGYGQIFQTGSAKEQIARFFSKETDEVKVFGSGSFFDEEQVSLDTRAFFVKECKQHGVKRVTVESRPEFITKEKLGEFDGMQLTVAIGLETADNSLLRKIDKGFTTSDFEGATRIIHEAGCLVRTYLLVNLPFIKNVEKNLDYSVNYAMAHSDSIVLINLLPHHRAQLFKMWLDGVWNFLTKEAFFDVTKKWKDNPKIELDAETFRFVPKFPKDLKENLWGVGEKYMTHPHFEVWQDYLLRWYVPPTEKDILLFLPCTYKKPYSSSETHKRIGERLRRLKDYGRIHQVMISNAGVVPREFESSYPFDSYDWNEKDETGEIRKRFIQVTAERIKKYLNAHRTNYEMIYCFLKYDSDSYKALEEACQTLDIKFSNLLKKETFDKIKDKKRPLQTEEALSDLKW